MAEKKEKTSEKEVIGNAPAVIATEGGKEVNVADLFKQIDNADVGLELGADYFKLEAGETDRVIFVEMTEITAINKPGEMTEAVKFLAKDGRFKINADKVIVSTCRALALKERKNVPLQITCTGEAKGKNGFKYKEFKINELLM